MQASQRQTEEEAGLPLYHDVLDRETSRCRLIPALAMCSLQKIYHAQRESTRLHFPAYPLLCTKREKQCLCSERYHRKFLAWRATAAAPASHETVAQSACQGRPNAPAMTRPGDTLRSPEALGGKDDTTVTTPDRLKRGVSGMTRVCRPTLFVRDVAL